MLAMVKIGLKIIVQRFNRDVFYNWLAPLSRIFMIKYDKYVSEGIYCGLENWVNMV